MPELRYPKPFVFVDSRRSKEYTGPGTFDVPEDAVEQYLNRGWERVSASADEGESESSAESSDGDVDVEVEETDDEDADVVYDAEAKPAEAGEESTATATGTPGGADAHADEDDDPSPEETHAESDRSSEPIVIDPDDDAGGESLVAYGDLTINELKDVLNERASELSTGQLRKLLSHEEENKNRKGAIRALESHLKNRGAGEDVDDYDTDAEPSAETDIDSDSQTE